MEDEAIISASNQQPVNPGPKAKPAAGRERTLEKTSWLSGSSAKFDALADLESSLEGSSKKPFNQFEGKKTNYSDNIYSTNLDMSKVSREQ